MRIPLGRDQRPVLRRRAGRRSAWVPTGADDAPLRRIDLAGGQASANQRQLRRKGLAGWQPGTTAGLLAAWQLTQKPGAFFDVGANAGVYSLLCRLLWPSMQAVAFEPSPSTLEAGRQWAAANGVEVTFEQAALSELDGGGTLYLSNKSDASHSLVAGFRQASGTLEVDLITLDGYVERTDLVPTVVKIDVEQHELAVLRGARRTLQRCRPVVVVEVLQAEQRQQAHELLCDLGYVARGLDARDRLYWPGTVPADWPGAVDGWLSAVRRCAPTRLA